MLPIRANCTRFCGFTSTFAPQSRSMVSPPLRLGSKGASAGRRIPFILGVNKIAAARTAPVEPAETNAFAFSSVFKSFAATTMDEFGLLLIASVGVSSHVITSSALTTETLDSSYSLSPSNFLMVFSLPTRTTSKPSFSLTASIAPLTISSGELSPPNASIIIFI